ncbi:MAG: hypothetical protein BGO14_01670 [Chlamydiales bacterium 38-26]|nr:hypothetical protein [Chlamydiales bacterium]OJV08156.1 MAG: hypothetical protein BGO14_01670 [Chlamydiales bacterium 38-26]
MVSSLSATKKSEFSPSYFSHGVNAEKRHLHAKYLPKDSVEITHLHRLRQQIPSKDFLEKSSPTAKLQDIAAKVKMLSSHSPNGLFLNSQTRQLEIRPTNNENYDYAAIQYIVDACHQFLNESRTHFFDQSIQEKILTRLTQTTWFKTFSAQDSSIYDLMSGLIHQFNRLEKRQSHHEIASVAKLAQRALSLKNQKFLETYATAHRRWLTLHERSCKQELSRLENKRQKILKQQMVLKILDQGNPSEMKEYDMISLSTLLFSYQWIMTSQELFECIQKCFCNLSEIIAASRPESEIAIQQQLRLLKFCNEWICSDLYQSEKDEIILSQLHRLVRFTQNSPSKRIKSMGGKLGEILSQTQSAKACQQQPLFPDFSKKLEVLKFNKKNLTEEVADSLGVFYTEALLNLKIKDLFKQDQSAETWASIAHLENTLSQDIVSFFKSIPKKNRIHILKNYIGLVKTCLNKHNYATAKTLISGLGALLNKEKWKLPKKLQAKIDELSHYAIYGMRKEMGHLLEKNETPFVPAPDYIGQKFQLLSVAPRFDSEDDQEPEKLNIEQFSSVEALVKQWVKMTALLQNYNKRMPRET